MSKLLEVSNLSVLIAEDQRVLVNDVSFSIEPGEAVELLEKVLGQDSHCPINSRLARSGPQNWFW